MKVLLKYVNDYYESLYKKFPNVPKSDIRKIVNFGWKSFYLHNSYGCDVLIRDSNFWSYIGNLYRNGYLHYNYYKRKLASKLRVLYKRNKIKWDGYYYFGLSEKEYDEYIASKTKDKGRPRKNITLYNIVFYKMYDECFLKMGYKKYFYKIASPIDRGFSFRKDKITVLNPILIEKIDSLKLKDILISNKKYMSICRKKQEMDLLKD